MQTTISNEFLTVTIDTHGAEVVSVKNSKGEEQIKYNLCGEFCVAFVMGVGIKQFLKDWENAPGSLYKWSLGGDSDKTSDVSLIKNMLSGYSYSVANGNVIDFAVTLIGPAFEDKTLSPGRFQKMLKTHSLLAQVVINKTVWFQFKRR